MGTYNLSQTQITDIQNSGLDAATQAAIELLIGGGGVRSAALKTGTSETFTANFESGVIIATSGLGVNLRLCSR